MKKKEMERLGNMLDEANIPYEQQVAFGNLQLIYPSKEIWISDAIYDNSDGSYLEIMGLVSDHINDEVERGLRAEDVFEKWSAHWEEHKYLLGAEPIDTHNSAITLADLLNKINEHIKEYSPSVLKERVSILQTTPNDLWILFDNREVSDISIKK